MTKAFQTLACSTLWVLSKGSVMPSVKAPPKPKAETEIQINGARCGTMASAIKPALDKIALAASHRRLSWDLLSEPNTGFPQRNAIVKQARIRPAFVCEAPYSRNI